MFYLGLGLITYYAHRILGHGAHKPIPGGGYHSPRPLSHAALLVRALAVTATALALLAWPVNAFCWLGIVILWATLLLWQRA